jgi:AsmA protein
MKVSIPERLKKISTRPLKISGLTFIGFILLIFLLPELFPGFVAKKIKGWANQSIESELNFSRSRLSLIKHFPALTLTVYDFSLNGSAPFSNDTLVAGKELSFGISLFSIFKSKLKVNEFYLNEAFINVQVDEKGNANYNIYTSTDTSSATSESTASLKISGIHIKKSRVVYSDRSLPLLATASDFNYNGEADLSEGLFDLHSKIKIQSLNVSYDGESYLLDKKIDASLITNVNTNSLAFSFQKNDIKINELPLSIKGTFDVLKNGYGVEIEVNSGQTGLRNLLSLLPPSMMGWYAKTALEGETEINASFKGNYIAATNTQPDLGFGLIIRNGYINHNKAAQGISGLQLKFKSVIPGLNMDNISVNLDTLSFKIGKDYVGSSVHSKGLNPMYVRSYSNANIDVGVLARVLGIDFFTIKGRTISKMNVDGVFETNNDSAKHRTLIKSLPVYDFSSSWTDGYFKMKAVPYAISNIACDVRSVCKKQNAGLSGLQLDLDPFTFNLAGKPFNLKAKLSDFESIHYDLQSHGTLDLEKLYGAFAQDGLGVKGYIETNFSLQGTEADVAAKRYDRLKNSGSLLMKDISVFYYPYSKPFVIKNGLLLFKQDKIWLQDFSTSYGKNELLLNGYVYNTLNYILKNDFLKGDLRLQSDLFEVNDFMNDLGTDSTVVVNDSAASTGVVMLPGDLSINVTASVKNVIYNQMQIKNFSGQLFIDKGNLLLDNTRFRIADGVFNVKANYEVIDPMNANFDLAIKADSFDVKKAYNEIQLFRELASAAEKAEGVISLDYKLKGRLNDSMMPVYPSLKGGGVLNVEHVKVYGLKLFNAVSKATGKDSIDNPDLSKVSIKTSIANNIINIERTKMKVFGFRPRIEGQASFDGRLNLKFRLGLPPFGLFGIPMTVRGTSEHPIIKLKRGKDGFVLDEEKEIQGPEE